MVPAVGWYQLPDLSYPILYKGLPGLVTPLIQQSETVESVKQRGGDNVNSHSRLSVTVDSKRARSSAESNSSRGMV